MSKREILKKTKKITKKTPQLITFCSDFEDALELDPENTEHVAQLNLVKEKIKLIKE